MTKQLEPNIQTELEEIRSKLTPFTIASYILGMLVIGIGVNLMKRSFVGLSSYDTFNYAISSWIPFITFGVASGILSTIAMLLTVHLYKNWVYFVMVVPIILTTLLIMLFDQVIFVNLEYTANWQHYLAYVAGLLLLPLGGSLMIITKLPAGVYDQFMLAVLNSVKTNNLPLIRAIIEVTVVLLALLVGIIAGIGRGQINTGTLIFSLTVGIFISFYLKIFERIGLYEPEQND